MDSGAGRCYDNARCESVIVIMKEEMFYSHKENLKIIQFIRQYFLSYNILMKGLAKKQIYINF